MNCVFQDSLPTVDSILYVDTDVIFLQSPERLWSYLAQFNDSHIAGMAAEAEGNTGSWYRSRSSVPYFPPAGLYVCLSVCLCIIQLITVYSYLS